MHDDTVRQWIESEEGVQRPPEHGCQRAKGFGENYKDVEQILPDRHLEGTEAGEDGGPVVESEIRKQPRISEEEKEAANK